MKHILVFDIGGTFIKYALMDETEAILERGKIKTPKDSREHLIETMHDVFQRYESAEGIAISMPGIIDVKLGRCEMGGALRYNDGYDLREALYRVCPVPIIMENDAKCAAMAEAASGSLADVKDGFVLIFGTMIGGGYIHDHNVVHGKHFSAGEVSYITTDGDADPAGESLFGVGCGTPKLCAMYAEKKGIDPAGVDGVTVFDAVARGEAEAVEVLNQYTRRIAVQVFNLQTVLDIERVAIGGGISARPEFTQYIRENLARLYEKCPYNIPHAEITTCRYFNDANLIGALHCWLRFAEKIK